jgi:hypothetical protein
MVANDIWRYTVQRLTRRSELKRYDSLPSMARTKQVASVLKATHSQCGDWYVSRTISSNFEVSALEVLQNASQRLSACHRK